MSEPTKTPDHLADIEKALVGRRVVLADKHPYAGRSGECVRLGKTVLGYRPVVRLDGDGHEVFAMDPKDWRIVK